MIIRATPNGTFCNVNSSVDFYQQLPSINDGTGNYVPDYNYAITINENTTITSQNGSSFITQDKIDFSVSSSLDPTEVSVYQISGNIPQYFLLKKSRNAISSTKIEPTKGMDYNGIEDVAYLRDKLFAALKVPKAFMGYEKDLPR